MSHPKILFHGKHVFIGEEWDLILNKYQRDNLLWLLALVANGDIVGANTGDWCGEIHNMLDPQIEASPNMSLEDYQEQHNSEGLREARMELLNLALANDSVRALMLTSANPLLRNLAK